MYLSIHLYFLHSSYYLAPYTTHIIRSLMCSDAVAKAVCVINNAVDSGDPVATLAALQAPAANIRSVIEECSADYASSLQAAKRAKTEEDGEDGEGWTEHRTREGHTFYYNWMSEQSQWEKPDDLPEQSCQLRREEIQVRVLLL